MLVLVYPRSAQGDYYYIVLNVLSQGSEDHTCGPHTAHYVQLRHLFLSLKCLNRGRVRNIGAEIP